MIVKGFLRLCAGIIGGNVLTFEDTEVTPAVTLKRLTEDYHSGREVIFDGETVEVRENHQSINFTILTIDGDLGLEGDLWLA